MEAAMPDSATLEIPQTVMDAAQMNANDLRRELALTLYAQHRLSLGKARELAGLSLCEFRQWLGLRRIEAHYDEVDLRDDLATLRALGRLP
jgi:predicted HTH domain antitoxin